MKDFTSDFFENGWLKIVRTLNGSLTDSYGNVITGVATYTWAQFTAGGFDLSIARYVIVTDKHSSISGYGGSLWYIDPSAPVGSKRICCSGGIVTTWAARPTVSDFNGLEILLSDYNYSKYRSNGTIYKPVGKALLFNGNFGTLAAPSLYVPLSSVGPQTFSWPTQPKIPANMGNVDSEFTIELVLYRDVATSGYAPVMNMYLGPNSNVTPTSDPIIWAGTMTAVVGYGRPRPSIELRGQKSILSTYTSVAGGGNLSAGSMVERLNPATTIDFGVDQYLQLILNATATTVAEKISIQSFKVWQDV